MVALAAEGFQVHVHAIGDRGVREALDAFAAAPTPATATCATTSPTSSWSTPTTCRASPSSASPPTCRRCGPATTTQMAELTMPFLGEERSTWQYPFGALHRAGARLVMGSDWPVTTPDPLAAIHTAVTRTSYGEAGRPARAVPARAGARPETAFAAYTSGSAWVNGRDRTTAPACSRPGHVADLVVLDRDPFAGPPEEIGAARVASTWVDGERSTGVSLDRAIGLTPSHRTLIPQ